MVGTVNRLGDAGAADVADILTKHPKLLKLDLYRNQIGDAGCGRVTDVLLKNVESLMYLNLYGAWRRRCHCCGVLCVAVVFDVPVSVT